MDNDSEVSERHHRTDVFDPQTISLFSLRPKLRSGLHVDKHCYRGEFCYLIRDPVGQQIHRLGQVEFDLLQSFDGRNCVSDALEMIAACHGVDAIDENEVAGLLSRLVESGLIEADTVETSDGGCIQSRLARSRRALTWGTLAQRVTIGNPDPILKKFVRTIPKPIWLLAIGLVVVTVASAGISGLGNVDLITSYAPRVLSPDRWLSLLVTFVALKCVHEVGHAVACRALGCAVRSFGIAMVVLVPMPYVNVSAASMLRNKWKRIVVSLAGVLTELVVASVAVIAFIHTSDAVWQARWFNVIVAAGVSSVVFNLNPLMRFDGYYVLADWVEIPNLASEGQQAVTLLRRSLLFGEPVAWNTIMGHRGVAVIYGFCATAWRIVITGRCWLLHQSY